MLTRVCVRFVASAVFTAGLGVIGLYGSMAQAAMDSGAAADVVSVRGQGEVQQKAAGWRKATVDQDLFTGDNVRTGSFSGMGLLFRDRTQIRLGEKSFLQVKQVGAAPASGNTLLKLNRGRAWTQSRRVGGTLLIETPAATAAIRGTDWDLRVGAGGVTTLTVLSGMVRFYNPYGSVTVNKNEAARAVPGQAPVKMIVVNPRERVQWVTAYQAEPDRHIAVTARGGKGDKRLQAIAKLIENQAYATALSRLRAMTASGAGGVSAPLMWSDLLMSLGDVEQAVKVAERAVRRYPREPAAKAHLARLYMITDQTPKAQALLKAALEQDPANREALYIQGRLARLEGDVNTARSAYEAGMAADPEDDRFWYGLGVVETEREDVHPARDYLGRAIQLNPEGLGYHGERGTLETFANNFGDAGKDFEAALKVNPDDFVALTGRGLMRLKRGETQAALDDFLAAGLMEPRYARAHMFAGVAYYQLGFVDHARQSFALASAVDPNDPMPHFLLAMIETDHYRPGEAVLEAQTARQKMPFLKSLNQIANDQKGTANLGRSFAYFGLGDWADSAAQDSYYPYWAGSHLFLADRYMGLYNKNSELYQGFLTDPTVFGASLRFQTLFEKPGLHAQMAYRYGQDDKITGRLPFVEVRGFDNGVVPFAFFLNRGRQELELPQFTDDNEIMTGAFGVKPVYGLGLFAYFNRNAYQSDITDSSIPIYANQDRDIDRVDLGASYKFGPTNQLWAKVGRTESDDRQIGLLTGLPVDVDLDYDQDEIALRHSFDWGGDQSAAGQGSGGHEITWGGEFARKRTDSLFSSFDPGGFFGFATVSQLDYRYDEDYRGFFISDRYRVTSRLTVQGDLHYVDFTRTADYDGQISVPTLGLSYAYDDGIEDLSVEEFLPRLGLAYEFGEGRMFRLAYQKWIRPPAVASLSPIATVGIPIDDRAVDIGGELERLRAQLEWQWTPRTFTKAYVDHQRIDNRRFRNLPFTLTEETELTTLSARDFAVITNEGFREYATKPDFDAGELTAAGLAINQIVTDDLSLFARYRYLESENTGANHAGNPLPYHPTHTVTVGGTWVTPFHTYLVGALTYRTDRFKDQANMLPLEASLDGRLDLFWESPDKRILARFGIDNFFDQNNDTFYSGELVLKF